MVSISHIDVTTVTHTRYSRYTVLAAAVIDDGILCSKHAYGASLLGAFDNNSELMRATLLTTLITGKSRRTRIKIHCSTLINKYVGRASIDRLQSATVIIAAPRNSSAFRIVTYHINVPNLGGRNRRNYTGIAFLVRQIRSSLSMHLVSMVCML